MSSEYLETAVLDTENWDNEIDKMRRYAELFSILVDEGVLTQYEVDKVRDNNFSVDLFFKLLDKWYKRLSNQGQEKVQEIDARVSARIENSAIFKFWKNWVEVEMAKYKSKIYVDDVLHNNI